MAKLETYKAARERLLNELAARGWTVRANLVRPRATEPGQDFSVWFHTQAVYFGFEQVGSRSMFLDIRGMPVQDLIDHAWKSYRSATIDPHKYDYLDEEGER